MGLVRLQPLFKELGNQKGQTFVEYILLILVVVTMISQVIRSDLFQSNFGKGGKLSQVTKGSYEYNYRHARNGTTPHNAQNFNYTGADHESYAGRFYTGKDPYPNN